MVDAAPGHVGHVQKPVHATEVDEGAVFGDVLHHAVDGLALVEVRDHLGALFGAALFQDRPARDHDIAAAAVHLQDLERLLHVHQRAGVAHRTHIDLAARQEGHGAAEIDGKAALDPAEDRAFDTLFIGIGLLEPVPSLFTAGLLAADHRFATDVLDAIEINLDHIAHFDRGGLHRGLQIP